VEALDLQRAQLLVVDVVAAPRMVAIVGRAADVLQNSRDRLTHLLHLRGVEHAGNEDVAVGAVERSVVCH